MRGLFHGTSHLVRFILRRDRARIPLWVLGLSAFMVALVPVFQNLLLTGEGNSVFAMMMENPAMVALVGPVYGAANFHTGAAYANMMLVFCVIFVAVMNIFLITRHTRADEEAGRVEMIRSLPVGRLASLGAAQLTAFFTNLLLALLTSLGLYLLRGTGMDLSGCLLFGFALFASGLVFAGITSIACQLTANNRTATGLALGVLMLMYLLRAAGDITAAEALSLLSPIGLATRTQVFVNNYAWPVLVMLLEAGLLVVLLMVACAAAGCGPGAHSRVSWHTPRVKKPVHATWTGAAPDAYHRPGLGLCLVFPGRHLCLRLWGNGRLSQQQSPAQSHVRDQPRLWRDRAVHLPPQRGNDHAGDGPYPHHPAARCDGGTRRPRGTSPGQIGVQI